MSSVFRTESEVTSQTVFWEIFPECLEIYGEIYSSILFTSKHQTCMHVYIELCRLRGHTFNAEQSNAAKIFEKAKCVLQNLFSGLKFRNITLKELDDMNYDIHKFKVVFNSFLKLQCFKDDAKFGSINTLQMELEAYRQLKEKKNKVLHFVHKILELAEGWVFFGK